jgi:hypothetical protein
VRGHAGAHGKSVTPRGARLAIGGYRVRTVSSRT